MLHIVAYDVASDRRLYRVAKICEDYGVRIEKSVFECDLDETEFERFWSRLQRVVADSDSVVDYPIVQSCREKIRTLGAARREMPTETLVF